MIAAVPPMVVDMAAWFGAAIALLTLAGLLWRTPLARWLRRSLREDLDAALRTAIREELAPIEERMERHEGYVRHHLGPNGTTKPIHVRLIDLEIAHRIPQDDEGDADDFG